jgi:hypothetical protein
MKITSVWGDLALIRESAQRKCPGTKKLNDNGIERVILQDTLLDLLKGIPKDDVVCFRFQDILHDGSVLLVGINHKQARQCCLLGTLCLGGGHGHASLHREGAEQKLTSPSG